MWGRALPRLICVLHWTKPRLGCLVREQVWGWEGVEGMERWREGKYTGPGAGDWGLNPVSVLPNHGASEGSLPLADLQPLSL